MKRRAQLRRRRNAQPTAVVSVPTMLRPTYCIPIQFVVTSTGTSLVNLPSALLTKAWKVTSIRATAGTATLMTVNIGIYSATTSGTVQDISAYSRPFIVAAGTLEISFRNSRNVQHGVLSSATTVPALAQFNLSGAGTVNGLAYVSVIGTFG